MPAPTVAAMLALGDWHVKVTGVRDAKHVAARITPIAYFFPWAR